MSNEPPTDSLMPDDRGPPRPERIGSYRILEKIGEGGFGEVYEAEQTEPVRRRVALKIIKPGMDSQAIVARFQAERQALAVMDHPGIAKIFDGGNGPELGSRPYFVMELVRGSSITQHCETHRLTIGQRCELFVKVCEAVEHAHTRGLIHRDLKPSNVLVAYTADGQSSPKVIDFGVAKALNTRLTDRTIFTGRDQLIGTPDYMSPEQAGMSGQAIDARADVYSLGVLLYELLCGVPPFDRERFRAAAETEVQRMIRDVDPPRPSARLGGLLREDSSSALVSAAADARRTDVKTMVGLLVRDLDWVVMRCLEKDRERRYPNARDLAEDLRRYGRGEAVEAGPPRLSYRVSKLVRRNTTAIAVAAVLVFVCTAAAAVVTVTRLSEIDAREEAAGRLAEIDRIQQGLVVLRSIRTAVRDLSDEAKAKDAQVRAEFEGRPRDEIDHRIELATSANASGDPLACEMHARRALELLEAAEAPPDERHVAALSGIGASMRRMGKHAEAIEYNTRALEVAVAIDDETQADSIRHNLGIAYNVAQRHAAAAELFDQCAAWRNEHLGAMHRRTLSVIASQGVALSRIGEPERAERLLRSTLAKAEASESDVGFEPLRLRQALAITLLDQGRGAEAVPLLADLPERLREMRGREFDGSVNAAHLLGRAYLQTERWEEAESVLSSAVLARVESIGRRDARLIEFMLDHVASLVGLQRWAEAEAMLLLAEAEHASLLALASDAGIEEQQLLESVPKLEQLREQIDATQ
ncbi:MAG: serine/threonine-protein kinase [Planctomycetota bacterium]